MAKRASKTPQTSLSVSPSEGTGRRGAIHGALPVNRVIHRDIALERLAHVKHREHASGNPLGPELIKFFKNSVTRQQGKFGKIAASWTQLVPPMLNDHCALESFSRGSLTVLVDSSSHLYELKQLLLSGIEQQLRLACQSSGLTKITLKPGRWYETAEDQSRRPRFGR